MDKKIYITEMVRYYNRQPPEYHGQILRHWDKTMPQYAEQVRQVVGRPRSAEMAQP